MSLLSSDVSPEGEMDGSAGETPQGLLETQALPRGPACSGPWLCQTAQPREAHTSSLGLSAKELMSSSSSYKNRKKIPQLKQRPQSSLLNSSS